MNVRRERVRGYELGSGRWRVRTQTSSRAVVARALAEDVGPGDVTTEATVPAGARGRARIVQKQPGVVFGLAAVAETMRQCGVDSVDNLIVEGQWRDAVPADVALAAGPAAGLLAAERTALNFLGHLSGVATLTARFVEAVAGTGARILDTRKTTPGLCAAREAGGRGRWRRQPPPRPLRRDPDQGEPRRPRRRPRRGGRRRPRRRARPRGRGRVPRPRRGRGRARGRGRPPPARQHGPRCPARGGRAARARGRAGDGPALEASGGVDLQSVREIAETGVELISVGALTHSAPRLDLSMLIEPLSG